MSKTDCYLVKKCMVNMCSKSGSLENNLFFGILRIRGVGTVKISGEAPKKIWIGNFFPVESTVSFLVIKVKKILLHKSMAIGLT